MKIKYQDLFNADKMFVARAFISINEAQNLVLSDSMVPDVIYLPEEKLCYSTKTI